MLENAVVYVCLLNVLTLGTAHETFCVGTIAGATAGAITGVSTGDPVGTFTGMETGAISGASTGDPVDPVGTITGMETGAITGATIGECGAVVGLFVTEFVSSKSMAVLSNNVPAAFNAVNNSALILYFPSFKLVHGLKSVPEFPHNVYVPRSMTVRVTVPDNDIFTEAGLCPVTTTWIVRFFGDTVFPKSTIAF
jgi:hypothetical protein